jgi:general secretion pathway protein A
MDYFRVLDLNREPFSNSPEPEFFFPAPQYAACLQHLELAIRLRRGLNVVIGEIGVGKSTLCRQLILRLSAQQEDRQQIETHLILDPSFGAPREFLSTVADLLEIPPFDPQETDWHVKEQIKNALFKKGVEEKKIVVLIIDEGQKLPDFCLELLREFLNFETNEYKLLQIVIFTQPEFSKILKEHASFADRINHHGFLGPMTGKQTSEMIRYRLRKAANGAPPALFTRWALRAIYRATGGYPRKVITLCHHLILAMITQQRTKADRDLVRSCLQIKPPARPPKVQWAMTASAAILLVLFLSFLWNWGTLWRPYSGEGQRKPEAMVTAAVPVIPPETARMATSPPAAHPPPATGTGQAVATPDRNGVRKTEGTATAAVSVIPPEPARTAASPPTAPPPVTGTGQTVAPPGGKGAMKPKAVVSAAVSGVTPEAARTATSPPTLPAPSAESAKTAVTPDKMPKILGQLSVRKDGSVLRMIKKIYGNNDLNRLKAVARSNPQIENINVVMAGKTVNFPALPVSWKPPPKKIYRLQVARKSDLKEAYGLIELYSPERPAVQLIPYWNSREGLVFAILLREGFADEATALSAKVQLPPPFASDAVIREQWDGDTIFFAHP